MEKDSLFEEVKAFVMRRETISLAEIQSVFKIGYICGCSIIDRLEGAGIIGAYGDSERRKVLVRSSGKITLSYSVSEAADKEDTILIAITGTGVRTTNKEHLGFMNTLISFIGPQMYAKTNNITVEYDALK